MNASTPFPWFLVAPLYAAPGRFYHDIHHIHEMLRAFSLWQKSENFSEEDVVLIEAAIWLHDAYYDPLSPGDNEIRSAAMVETFGDCFTPHQGQQLADAILATAHHTADQEHLSPLSQWLLDLDLSNLGASEEVFLRQSGRACKELEVAGMPRPAIGLGQNRWAHAMLSRRRIFYNQGPFELYEKTARKNLKALLDKE